MQISSAKELKAYQLAYELAMDVFVLGKGWPEGERYSLTDQIRRSSRSVCTNLREAWAMRKYEAHFVSKLTDADGENSETDTWLDFCSDCGYLNELKHAELTTKCRKVGKMLGGMLSNPKPFILKPVRVAPGDPTSDL
ncbi:MAG TPA: four helix bundle protein [archaeon]|nr:four helix bundle protein [archaeon]